MNRVPLIPGVTHSLGSKDRQMKSRVKGHLSSQGQAAGPSSAHNGLCNDVWLLPSSRAAIQSSWQTREDGWGKQTGWFGSKIATSPATACDHDPHAHSTAILRHTAGPAAAPSPCRPPMSALHAPPAHPPLPLASPPTRWGRPGCAALPPGAQPTPHKLPGWTPQAPPAVVDC